MGRSHIVLGSSLMSDVFAVLRNLDGRCITVEYASRDDEGRDDDSDRDRRDRRRSPDYGRYPRFVEHAYGGLCHAFIHGARFVCAV